MSSFSSDFGDDLDEDDLRQLDVAEHEALSHVQTSSTPITSSGLLPYSKLIGQSPLTSGSPKRTLPWLVPPSFSSIPSSSLANRNPGQQVKGRSRANEPPTHHSIDNTAAKTWTYPTNVSFREYQFNIVQRALFDNILVSLPTGLGKTFI